MPKHIAAVIILIAIVTSCQRSNDIQRLNNGPLFVKSVSVSGTGTSCYDTLIITYDYDANSRLTKETFFFCFQTATGIQRLPIEREYTRDGAGRVTRIRSTFRYVADPLTPVPSFFNVVYVDNNSTKVGYITNDNNSFKTVFIYNSSGRIEKTEYFQHFPQPTDPLRMTGFDTHLYDAAGNLLSLTLFRDSDNNGILEQNISFAFEYDSKVNPLFANDDALFQWRWSMASPANCTKQTNIYGGGTPSDGLNYQYQYRSDNRPERSTKTDFSGPVSGPATTTYFYQ